MQPQLLAIEFIRLALLLMIIGLILQTNRRLFEHHDKAVVRMRRLERQNRDLRGRLGMPIEWEDDET